MSEYEKVPRGKTLLEVLEEKHKLPVTIFKYTICAPCLKPLSRTFRPSVVLQAARDNWRLPALFFCPLCKTCAAKYHRGGRNKSTVVNAFWEFIEKEAAQ
ncbi:hypothetical protein SAMN05216420_11092 [Nitrosospira sp. Nl5]|uniref:hypothetical protein n=1 Tax=Nitrosospira sp. Nl5 TaxID=200120 RepID=UPI000882BE66|nr:hypothetical protein [Nitrosospira sp. Nl5]SCY62512.1 hypothetical protein SAMN05216420_11092 [Nitrosospira sp. Nl5]